MDPRRDHIVRAFLRNPDDEGEAVRVLAGVTTDVAAEAARRHHAVAGAAVALARVATSGLLLATLTKGGEKVTLQILGSGPLGGLTADANDAGDVRVYASASDVLVPGGAGRRVALGHAVGRQGVVNVIRDLGMREQYRGQSPIITGEIDEDVESYLRMSEQIDSALGCEAVLAEGMGGVAASGGLLVQAMPGSQHAGTIREVQHRLRTGALYDILAAGGEAATDGEVMIRELLGELGGDRLEVLDRRPVRFFCPCNRERVDATLALLDDSDLDAMIKEDGRAEVTCNFCGERYEVPGADLERIRAERGVRGQS